AWVQIGPFGRRSPRWSVTMRARPPDAPRPRERQGDLSLGPRYYRPAGDASGCMAKARARSSPRGFARDLTSSYATIDKSPRRTSMLTAFGSARGYGLRSGLWGPASRLSLLLHAPVRRHRRILRGRLFCDVDWIGFLVWGRCRC